MNSKLLSIGGQVLFTGVLCTIAWFSATGFMNSLDEKAQRAFKHNNIMSEIAFMEGTYRLVWMPEVAFQGVFGPNVSMVMVDDGDNLLGPDLFVTEEGWLFKSMEIVESPDLEITLTNLKTWTWTCPYRWGSYTNGGMCIANERWEGEDSWNGAWVHRLVYTTEAEAQAACAEHNEEEGHNAKVFELLNGQPVTE